MLFDADAHYAPKDAYDNMKGPHRAMRPRIQADGIGYTMRFLGRNHPRVAHSFPLDQTCNFERRMQDLDRLGIDCQLLFPSHSGIYQEITDPGAARDLVQSHNDGMAEVQRKSNGRLISTFCLTLQHPDVALEELQRCVKLGLRTAVVCPNVDGGPMDDLPLWDFWAEAERLGVVIALHGDSDSKLVGHERFNRWRLFNCLGFPFDYMHGIVCMIYSGLLDRFPKLKIMLAEAGVSFLPFLEDRLNDTSETFHSPLAYDNFDIRRKPANKRPPAEYFQMFHHAVGLDESLLDFVIGKYGAEKFLIGTDYPHPDAHMNVAHSVEKLSSMSKEAFEAITWKNAERLFGVKAVPKAKPKPVAAE